MKQLTSILEHVRQQKEVTNIDTNDKFITYVNEQLLTKPGYSYEGAICVAQNLLDQYGSDFHGAINQFTSFQ